MQNNKKVVIIWAGFGGLGSAILMAKKWYDVTVIEKNDKPGGRANLLEANGYKRDMWPSRYLMPDAFEKYFSAIGENISDHFELQKLSPSYRVFFKWEKTEWDKSDNSDSITKSQMIDIYSDIDKAAETFESIEIWAGDQLRKYLKSAEYQYNIAMNQFVYKNFDSIWDFMDPKLGIEWLKLNIFTTLYNYVSKFVKDERLKKILMYPSVFLGTSPYKTPALFNIMSHVDFNQWVFYPKWWIHEIIKSLEKIAIKAWVKFLYDSQVEKIDVADGKAKGIYIKNKSENSVSINDNIYIPADIVISNADMHHTETKLLDSKFQSYPESYRAKKVISPSWFILYLWVDGKLPQLQHHTLIFNHDWKKWFAEVFQNPIRPTDPSYYICNPSKTDPSTAPEGKENLFLLVPIAPWLEYSDDILAKYADFMIDDISRACDIPDLRSRIQFQQIFSLPQFESYYNAYKWTALWLAHTFFQSAIRRPANYSKKVKWLYYAGGYTTPGIGMPMCLISAMMVADRIDKNDK